MTSQPTQRFRDPAPTSAKAIFLLPLLLVVLGAFGTGLGHAALAFAFCLLISLVIWRGWPGRYLAVIALLAGWWAITLALGALLTGIHVILAIAVTLVGAIGSLWLTVRIAAPWGWQRYDRMAERGRPMREWEWVWTGPAFARSHPLARHLGFGYVVVLFVAGVAWVRLGFGWQVLVSVPDVWGKGWMGAAAMTLLLITLVALSALALLTLWLLIRKSPGAWMPTWFFLVLGLPWSIPLMFYWAEAARPNLIYRHRFERLSPLPRKVPETHV